MSVAALPGLPAPVASNIGPAGSPGDPSPGDDTGGGFLAALQAVAPGRDTGAPGTTAASDEPFTGTTAATGDGSSSAPGSATAPTTSRRSRHGQKDTAAEDGSTATVQPSSTGADGPVPTSGSNGPATSIGNSGPATGAGTPAGVSAAVPSVAVAAVDAVATSGIAATSASASNPSADGPVAAVDSGAPAATTTTLGAGDGAVGVAPPAG
ncbi:MAG TPA: hypothetical protein VGG23_08370, partial [Acidimicrobiales bacterium]